MEKSGYGLIASIIENSIAAELDWRPGDALLSINGHRLRDVIDYRFYGAEEWLTVVLEREGTRFVYEIERHYDEELGVEFSQPLFDGLRRCANRCQFCFIDGLPPGMRPSLYIKDDDYRYSFLLGNFVTLTNLTEEDWERLAEQRLSPLYVSVHASEAALRRRLLGRGVPDILEQVRRLGEMGIQVHAQIVLVPGLNDGPALERTVSDLGALYPTVQSISVVPIGLTRHHRGPCRVYTSPEAIPIVEQIAAWQGEFRARHGLNLVYASDEWYLMAGQNLPPADAYDDFPQLENGVGLTRSFIDEWNESRQQAAGNEPRAQGRKITLVCGELMASIMRQLTARFAVEVLPVANEFFGPTVTVSGLLTGQDVVNALRSRQPGDLVLLPRAMFEASGQMTLDDLTRPDIARALPAPIEVVAVATAGELFSLLCQQENGIISQM